jgi:hypothetical protein
MSVRENLQLQLGVASQLRWFLIIALAAALIFFYPEHSATAFQHLWDFAAFLLYLWLLGTLLGTLLGAPMARPKCPRCATKFALRPGVTSCPSCALSFDATVQRNWRHTSET